MNNKKRRFTISKKMYIFLIITVLCAVGGFGLVAYAINVSQIDSYFKRLTINSAENFSAFVDVDFFKELRKLAESDEYQAIRDEAEEKDDTSLIQDYLVENGLWDRYIEQRNLLAKYLKNMNDIKYLYIVAWGDSDDTSDMYLMDDDETPIYETGYYSPREAEFAGVETDGVIGPIINNGEWGWLCSGYYPIYDDTGSIVCHVGCDVDMEEVMKARLKNLIYMALGALAFIIVVFVGAFVFVEKSVVSPLVTLTRGMKKFSPAVNVDYEEAGVIDIDFKTNDEINDIYEELRIMQIRIIDYINDITTIRRDKEKAEDDVREKEKIIGEISEEAYKDALTGVGSKAAYNKKINEIDGTIQDGTAEFAVIMVDVNFLKKVNDTYGHKAGDTYIKGCCKLISSVFAQSPIYRIGGDEFVLILTGKEFEERNEKFEELKAAFAEAYGKEDLDPWYRYSASAGMSEYTSLDESAEVVFKRADKCMYEAKIKFKKDNGIPVNSRM